jgi:hypothetical protein
MFYLPELESDGSNYEDITDALALLQAGLLVATDCAHVSTTLTIPYDTGSGAPPATVTAQRELAVRIKYRDAVTGRIEHATVPGPITTFYPPTGVKGDYIPLDNVVFAAYIILMEANMVSQDDNAIEVLEGRLTGRNS